MDRDSLLLAIVVLQARPPPCNGKQITFFLSEYFSEPHLINKHSKQPLNNDFYLAYLEYGITSHNAHFRRMREARQRKMFTALKEA